MFVLSCPAKNGALNFFYGIAGIYCQIKSNMATIRNISSADYWDMPPMILQNLLSIKIISKEKMLFKYAVLANIAKNSAMIAAAYRANEPGCFNSGVIFE